MIYRNRTAITVFLTIITITSFLFYWIKSNKGTYADEIISNSSQTFKGRLNKFLSSAVFTISNIESNIKKANGELFKEKNLDAFYSKMIGGDNYLQGVVLSHDKYNYIIYKDNSTWVTTYDINTHDSLVNWKRLNNKFNVVSEWTDNYTFFSKKNKLKGVRDKLKNANYFWRVSKSTMLGNSDLLTNIFETSNSNNEKILVGILFDVKKLTKDFSSVLKFSHPLISVITSSKEIVTPIITTDSSAISVYDELKPDIKSFIDTWENSTHSTGHSYSFEKLGNIYWTRIDSLQEKVGVTGFALTISAEDLAKTERKTEFIYLSVSIVFLILTLVFSLLMFIKKRKSSSVVTEYELQVLSTVKVLDLIKNGETEFVEFKSSLRWDYREEKVNKILEYVILKSVAAFANAKGGTLLIGVSDDMKILGLEKDFSTLKKQDADYFELHIRKLINNEYGIAFSNENLLMQFLVIDDKTICSIQIKASGTPVFLKSKNKQGALIEKFYVRSGNASQEISSLTKINHYIKIRFDK